MSNENIEPVRRGFEAFNARDVDQLVELSHPDSEWLPFRAQLEGESYIGREGVRAFVADMHDDWETFQLVPERFEASGNLVVVIARIDAVGRGSGVTVDSLGGFVFEIKDGLILRLTSHSDPQAALDALC